MTGRGEVVRKLSPQGRSGDEWSEEMGMTELRELFAEAANSSPPSRLVAEKVYAAGCRRRRRRSAAAVGAMAAMVSVIAALGSARLVPEPSADGVPPAGRVTPAGGAVPHPGQPIQWAGAADAKHLYLSFMACTDSPCSKTIVQLSGSRDGGRTWFDGGTPINAPRLAVLGPETLLAAIRPATGPGDGTLTLQVSTDGGRSWHTPEHATAVAAVPTGSTAVCWSETSADSCTLRAVDPAAHRVAPLLNQPALVLDPDDLRPAQTAGRIWVRGVDRATGRPAVGVSGDAGRTWSVQVFADAPACWEEGCQAPYLATGDGWTAYAVTVGVQHRAVYRYLDDGGRGGGRWQRVAGADSVADDRLTGGERSFVTADGTHVLFQVVSQRGQDVDGYRFWAARGGGGAYQPVELDGLPATVYPIRRAADGWFYTHSYVDNVLYGSTDGWHWSPVTGGS